MNQMNAAVEAYLLAEYLTTPDKAAVWQLHNAIAYALKGEIALSWMESQKNHGKHKRAYYFSAEFLVGRMIYNNLYCLGQLDETEAYLKRQGRSLAELEEIEDMALGNGGLGRLAACFLDSAATHNLPLDGYGIRYRYGLFRQRMQDGFQREEADDWTRLGDGWSNRMEEQKVQVSFSDQTVWAVPYDMPVIGYGTHNIGTLRLWQSEEIEAFNLVQFNNQEYLAAAEEGVKAGAISAVLYPDDTTMEGKRLRLRQQYFFSSASLQDIIRRHLENGESLTDLHKKVAVQLNDTHPVVSIPEFIRLLTTEHGVSFTQAVEQARAVFSYTNHTIMAEALEQWDVDVFRRLLPAVYEVVEKLDGLLCEELKDKDLSQLRIIDNGRIHMARLAVYMTHAVNGVAKIHTELLMHREMKEWYTLYPQRFINKTNGITQRRWLGLCNPQLSQEITSLLGSDSWLKDLSQLEKLKSYAQDKVVLSRFREIKRQKKEELCRYIEKEEGVTLSPDFIFDIQIKRLHEYKRQLMNALSILWIYFALKDDSLKEFHPTVYLFGAKAAPGYRRAKGIIKLIGAVASLVNNDAATKDKLQVVFTSNYNVSYAEKLIPAADISEQISTAGTEASGTGNMKFMLNGAVTLGTYDGANVEIVAQAGEENNYIFGARVEEVKDILHKLDPKQLCQQNEELARVVHALVDGTLHDGGTGMFRDIYDALMEGSSWQRADNYLVLYDLPDYVQTKLRANKDYENKEAFSRKCWMNLAGAGYFSSDRTVLEYAKEIWGISPEK